MSVMEERPARTRRSFTDQFKREAVAMVLDDGNRDRDPPARRRWAPGCSPASEQRSGLVASCGGFSRRGRQEPSGPSAQIAQVDATRIGGGNKALGEIERLLDDRRLRRSLLAHVVEDRPLRA